MKNLGISIYFDHADRDKNLSYLESAYGLGFKRVFTCLISGAMNTNSMEDLKNITSRARELAMEVIADVDGGVFKKYGLDYKDLTFFHNLRLSGLRLDTGFSGLEESLMTCNPYGLKIELNMSNGTRYLENILSHKPNLENLVGCHNFYPHKYTGLSRAHFLKCTRMFKGYGIKTAAFVSSKTATLGPWPLEEGLCTLEEHRFLPIEVQAKDLFNTNLIDDVIIANAFAHEKELEELSELDKNILTLKIDLAEGIPDVEKDILLNELHFNRGDVSEYVIRSTQSRVKYSGHYFSVFNPVDIKRGDLLIDSSLYGRYAGELQIALKDMENSGKTNVVGRVAEEEVFLLEFIEPWQKFKLRVK